MVCWMEMSRSRRPMATQVVFKPWLATAIGKVAVIGRSRSRARRQPLWRIVSGAVDENRWSLRSIGRMPGSREPEGERRKPPPRRPTRIRVSERQRCATPKTGSRGAARGRDRSWGALQGQDHAVVADHGSLAGTCGPAASREVAGVAAEALVEQRPEGVARAGECPADGRLVVQLNVSGLGGVAGLVDGRAGEDR